MTLKILKPTTPGQRGTILVDKSHLWKGNSLKSLIVKSIPSTTSKIIAAIVKIIMNLI